MANKIEKVNSLIQEELGQIILKEMDLPKDILITITRVETSVDFSNAKICISVFPEEKADWPVSVLKKSVYFLQQLLNKRLKMRPVPKIRFVKDDLNSNAARVESIISGLKKQE